VPVEKTAVIAGKRVEKCYL